MNIVKNSARSERAETIQERQARYLAARFRLSTTLAQLLAEHAFKTAPLR